MLLKFFGRGSGFSDDNTSAYFESKNNELVIIDCSIFTFQKLKYMDLSKFKDIYVCITHTHGDHISGLGLFVQFSYFVLNKIITIVTPTRMIANDIVTLLTIEGNDIEWSRIVTINVVKNKSWFKQCILTNHSPQLEGKCFGYQFNVDDVNVVYTGDTSEIESFIPYLTSGTELYIDVSVDYGMIHLKLEDVLETLISLSRCGIKVYLMHLDDIEKAQELVRNYSNIKVVEVD